METILLIILAAPILSFFALFLVEGKWLILPGLILASTLAIGMAGFGLLQEMGAAWSGGTSHGPFEYGALGFLIGGGIAAAVGFSRHAFSEEKLRSLSGEESDS